MCLHAQPSSAELVSAGAGPDCVCGNDEHPTAVHEELVFGIVLMGGLCTVPSSAFAVQVTALATAWTDAYTR